MAVSNFTLWLVVLNGILQENNNFLRKTIGQQIASWNLIPVLQQYQRWGIIQWKESLVPSPPSLSPSIPSSLVPVKRATERLWESYDPQQLRLLVLGIVQERHSHPWEHQHVHPDNLFGCFRSGFSYGSRKPNDTTAGTERTDCLVNLPNKRSLGNWYEKGYKVIQIK